jgi:hypothetical protein
VKLGWQRENKDRGMYSKQKGIMQNLKKGAIIMVEMGTGKIASVRWEAFKLVKDWSPTA